MTSQESRRPYPATFRAVATDANPESSAYDPALQHFPQAFRALPPAFEEPTRRRLWLDVRRSASLNLIERLANSPWSDKLVLRGSWAMSAWFGSRAREPGDVDWIVTDIDPGEELHPVVAWLKSSVACDAEFAGGQFEAKSAAVDPIWQYVRCHGQRLVIPWTAHRLPAGWVQFDFAFGERLWDEPVLVELKLHNERSIFVRAASKEQSFWWKALWIARDIHAMGKDLFDAALLSEHVGIDGNLRANFVREICGHEGLLAKTLTHFGGPFEWDELRQDFPDCESHEAEWLARVRRLVFASS